MRNAVLLSLISIILVSLITIGATYVIPEQVPREFSSSEVSIEPPESEDTSHYPYLLREYEGKLAVFTDDLVEPDMVFDVYVKTLPEFDREQLKTGVRVETYDKLVNLIEDYIS